MQIEPGIAMVLYWPRIQPERGPDGEEPSFKEAKKKYDERVAEIERWMEAAKALRSIQRLRQRTFTRLEARSACPGHRRGSSRF